MQGALPEEDFQNERQRLSHGVLLLVGEDAFFRLALKSLAASQLGFADFVEATTFEEALSHLAREPRLALALFDLALPGLERVQSLRHIREAYPHVFVVVVASSSDRGDVLAALEAGVHGFVPKQLGIEGLIRALTMILDGWIYVPASVADLSSADEERKPSTGASGAGLPSRSLPPRQRQILAYLAEGKTNREIADALNLSEHTVKAHLMTLFRSLGVRTRAEAVMVGRHQEDQQSSSPQDPLSGLGGAEEGGRLRSDVPLQGGPLGGRLSRRAAWGRSIKRVTQRHGP
jgi:DNA-binding NarL/FixJ family response regulator